MATAPRPLLARPSTWLIGLLIVATIASYQFFRMWVRGGETTTLTWRFEGTCSVVPGVAGGEDMVLDRERRVLWVSSDDRRPGREAAPGAIHAIAFDAPALAANPAAITGLAADARFNPHGLSLHVAADGSRTLMVVNHPNGADYTGSTIEIFSVGEDNGLTHTRSVAIPGLIRINDVLATGPGTFYATSESDLASGSTGEVFALYFDTDRSGAIWQFDGTTGRKVASGIGFANSLELSPDGSRLYATGTMDRTLHIYARDTATGALSERDKVFLGTGLDNITVEPDGRLWIAAHPKLFTFIRHAGDPDGTPAPNQVLIIEPAEDGPGGKVDQVLLEPGDASFAGAAVAVRDGSRMVMGPVFSPNLKVCTLPAVWKQSESHPAQRLIDPARDDAKKAAEKAAERAAEEAAKAKAP